VQNSTYSCPTMTSTAQIVLPVTIQVLLVIGLVILFKYIHYLVSAMGVCQSNLFVWYQHFCLSKYSLCGQILHVAFGCPSQGLHRQPTEQKRHYIVIRRTHVGMSAVEESRSCQQCPAQVK